MQPLTLEEKELAVLFAPPLTLALSPPAVLNLPPGTLKNVAEIVFSCPASRRPCEESLCSMPLTTLGARHWAGGVTEDLVRPLGSGHLDDQPPNRECTHRWRQRTTDCIF